MIQLYLREEDSYFWALHTGAELNLVFQRKGKLWGVEVTYNESPTVTRSMLSSLSELDLMYLWVIYPGKDIYPLGKKITAVGLWRLQDSIENPKRPFPVDTT